MLTDTAGPPTDARKFVLRGVAGSLGFFGLLRLPWTEAHVVLPLTRAQGALAVGLFGTPTLPVEATLACSGADALALCLGAILAYPVKWRTRLFGAMGGIALILALNTVRIGTLGRAAAAPAWFNALHLYVWPALLTLAIAGYVFAWMRMGDRGTGGGDRGTGVGDRGTGVGDRAETARDVARREPVAARVAPQPSRRFVLFTVACLLLFSAASPLYLESASVLALAGFIARAAATILDIVGVSAHAAANVLVTPRGAFLVTQECISTPLIPIYLAGVCTYSMTWRRLILGVTATLPLFIALGIVRLLVVALPDVVASPLFFVHAFYQLLLGAVVVFLAALWRHRGRAALGHALVGVIVGVLFIYWLGPLYTGVVTYQAGTPLDDPQGAIALLPAFQVGLYLALWIAGFVALGPLYGSLRESCTRCIANLQSRIAVPARGARESQQRTASRGCCEISRAAPSAGFRRFVAGLAILELTQTAGLLALHTLTTHSGVTAHVRDIRGWAVAGPLLIVAVVVNLARTRR